MNTISTFIENEPLTGGDDCDTETEVAINDSTINCNILFNSTLSSRYSGGPKGRRENQAKMGKGD